MPDWVRHLEAMARFRVSGGQEGSTFDHSRKVVDDAPMASIALTAPQTSGVLKVSESTVKRLIKNGELPTVLIGRSRRILRSDLDIYVAGLKRGSGQNGDNPV